MMVCGWCGHYFDPSDKRCFIPGPKSKRSTLTCPACELHPLDDRMLVIENMGPTRADIWSKDVMVLDGYDGLFTIM